MPPSGWPQTMQRKTLTSTPTIHSIHFNWLIHRRTRRQDIRNGDPLSQCSDLQHHGTQTSLNKLTLHPCSCSQVSPFCLCVHTPTYKYTYYLFIDSDDMDGLGSSVEDRSVFGVENSSMFLECSPKSQRALIYWQLQRPNDDRRQEVCM